MIANIVFYAIVIVGNVNSQTREKRLLLTDPTVINSHITELQHQLQELTSRFDAQAATVQSQQSKLLSQEAALQTQKIQLSAQEKIITELKATQDGTHKGGATYIRWGKHGCPDNDTELVYSGFAGGSYFAHSGAAAEYVCLSPNPVFATLPDVVRYAFMYGAEYDSNAFGHDNGDDMPCAVCRSRSATSSIMIPGTNNCVPGWRTQYKGYLGAGAYDETAASQYICLDAASETVVNGQVNNNGKLVQPVKAVCGALECPPYHDGKILTCVVCSK